MMKFFLLCNYKLIITGKFKEFIVVMIIKIKDNINIYIYNFI